MALSTDDIRSELNNLIQTCKDGEQGFRHCADKATGTSLRESFRHYASTRASYASELQSEVAKLGGQPETSGSTAGAMHRGWISLVEKMSSTDDHALLAEAERGEDSAVKAYRDALAKDLPTDIRQIVERQYRAILETHNLIRTERDAAEQIKTGTGTM